MTRGKEYSAVVRTLLFEPGRCRCGLLIRFPFTYRRFYQLRNIALNEVGYHHHLGITRITQVLPYFCLKGKWELRKVRAADAVQPRALGNNSLLHLVENKWMLCTYVTLGLAEAETAVPVYVSVLTLTVSPSQITRQQSIVYKYAPNPDGCFYCAARTM